MSSNSPHHRALIYPQFGQPRDVLQLGDQPTVFDPQRLAVRMQMAPINPSDLIPITGAYSHLIKPPMVAGYEGVGIVKAAPASHQHLIGRRVLPLRGEGTWQDIVQCDPDIAVPVPDGIRDDLAARSYINPLTALQLLRMWPVAGQRIILTGAGSFIAAILAQWALQDGAREVIAVYRAPSRRKGLEALGVRAVHESDLDEIRRLSAGATIAFDAVGGTLGASVMNAMPAGGEFVGYGLLSGQPVFPTAQTRANMRRFHLRDVLKDLTPSAWQEAFVPLWPRLLDADLPAATVFPMSQWRDALDEFERSGRPAKPVLSFA